MTETTAPAEIIPATTTRPPPVAPQSTQGAPLTLFGTSDPAAVEKLWRLDARNLRITTLRGIAERAWRTERGSPDADLTDEEATHLADYVRATEDTFVEVTRGDPILTEKPVHKSPQWVQKLNHGERAKPKGAR